MERFDRQARNEAVLRAINDRIASLGEGSTGWAGPQQTFSFECECGNVDGCQEHVVMTLAEYERVRSQKDRFAVLPGHQTAAIEQVVEQSARFLIVDKRDEFEPLVE
jgi:hypothetical protein